MALSKLLSSLTGKQKEVSTTDTVEQIKEARVYTPDGLSATSLEHEWRWNNVGTDFGGDTATLGGVANYATGAFSDANGALQASGGEGYATFTAGTGSTYAPEATPFTVEFWIYKTGQAPGGLSNTIFQTGGFEIATTPAHLVNLGVPNQTSVDISSDLSTWVHLACVFDGVNTTSYKNGVQVGSPTASSGWGASVVADSAAGRFMQKAGSLVANRYFLGRIDGFRIWSRALSSDELTTIVNATTDDHTAIGDLPSDGDVVYLGANGAAPADASTESKSEVLGVWNNTESAVTTKRGSEITVGDSSYEGGTNAFSAGDSAYLSAVNPGKMVKTAPTTAGHTVVYLGKMESATKLILDIQERYTN